MVYLMREKISDFVVPCDIQVYDIPELMKLDCIHLNSNEQVKKLLNGITIDMKCTDNKMYHCYYNSEYLGIIDALNNKIKKSKFFVKREKYEKN